jgi:hypothetical protein
VIGEHLREARDDLVSREARCLRPGESARWTVSRRNGLPDVHYGDEEHFVDAAANTGMSKWLLTGTTRDGTRREVHGCDFYTFRDGMVIRKDSYWKIVE